MKLLNFFWLYPCFAVADLAPSIRLLQVQDLEAVVYLKGNEDRLFMPQKGDEDPDMIPFKDPESGLIGYKNASGQTVIKPQFQRAHPFSKKFKLADALKDVGGVWNWYKIDQKGALLFKSHDYDSDPDPYCKGLSRFVEKGKIGFIDQEGKVVIPATFDAATPFDYNAPLSVVCVGCRKISRGCHDDIVGGKWGAIGREGNIVVPLEFDKFEFSRGMQIVFCKEGREYWLYKSPDGLQLVTRALSGLKSR